MRAFSLIFSILLLILILSSPSQAVMRRVVEQPGSDATSQPTVQHPAAPTANQGKKSFSVPDLNPAAPMKPALDNGNHPSQSN